MNKLELLPEGSKILKTVSDEIPVDQISTFEVQTLITDMIELMNEQRALGLAAIQVGLPLRIFVMKTDSGDQAVINPVINNHSDDIVAASEGCLSFPGLYLVVRRSGTVGVTFTDANGQQITTTYSGTQAQCFQHELDHLNGLTFDEKVSRIALNNARSKRKKLK